LKLLWVLRICLYVQLLLGIVRFFGPRVSDFVLNQHIWELHRGLAFVIAILAIIALRPKPGVENNGIRITARFFPLLPLLLGLGFMLGIAYSESLVILHMVLGIISLALVEMAAARERRSRVASA